MSILLLKIGASFLWAGWFAALLRDIKRYYNEIVDLMTSLLREGAISSRQFEELWRYFNYKEPPEFYLIWPALIALLVWWLL